MLYLDTSVLVAAVVNEIHSGLARQWLLAREPNELVISQWTITEFSAALSVKLRVGELSLEQRNAGLTTFSRWVQEVFQVVEVGQADFIGAARFADIESTALRAGDALHAAIAFNHGLVLCTLDKGLTKARLLGVEVTLIS